MKWTRTRQVGTRFDGGVHLWQARFPEWRDRLVALRSFLSIDEVERGARFLRSNDRERYYFAHGILRRILAGGCDCDPINLRFGLGEHGKPYVVSPPPESHNIEFNLSHSGDCVLIGVGVGRSIGVDVERLSRRVECESLGERFFSLEEAKSIRVLPETSRRRRFFETWVCKEAFIKAVGKGMTMQLDSFTVRFKGKLTAVEGSVGQSNPHLGRAWSVDRFEMAPGYVGAVAVRTQNLSLTGFVLQ